MLFSETNVWAYLVYPEIDTVLEMLRYTQSYP